MKEKILFLSIGGFGAGIIIRSFFDISYLSAILGIVVASFFFLFWKVRGSVFFLSVAILVFSGSAGVVRFDMKDRGGINEEWQKFVGTRVIVRGIVRDEPDERDNYTRLLLFTHKIFDWEKKEWRDLSEEKVLLTTAHFPIFAYGDTIEVNGRLQIPVNFEDRDLSRAGSREFDWEGYLAKDEIYLQMFYPTITRSDFGGSDVTRPMQFKKLLFLLKEKYLESIADVLPEPHAAFLGGLTVGAKRAMPRELLRDFRKVGVIHIVVLSGYNVTIIARALAGLLGLFLPLLASIVAGVISIILFAILTGAAAPVVRASIMAILIYTAHATGRVNRVIIALLIAATLMLIHNPKLLRFDPSFQLSFVATLGLIYLAPYFEKKLRWLPKRFNIREAATATLSAQIAVTPLLLSMMGTVSLVALPANILVLIAVPYAMFFGFIAGILGMISAIVAFPFTTVAYILLSYQLFVVDLFSSLPFAEFAFPFL